MTLWCNGDVEGIEVKSNIIIYDSEAEMCVFSELEILGKIRYYGVRERGMEDNNKWWWLVT
jgi:hypothetical protein